jgi:ABC-type proline/glycine betaine transport system permease subunit
MNTYVTLYDVNSYIHHANPELGITAINSVLPISSLSWAHIELRGSRWNAILLVGTEEVRWRYQASNVGTLLL